MIGAAVLLAGLSYQASGSNSAQLWGFKSETRMEAVAVDKNSGQVVWTADIDAGRYSDSPDVIPTLLTKYLSAG